MSNQQIGDISNLISPKKPSVPKKQPSRIEVLEARVATLEAALKTVLEELTALRETVDRMSHPTPKAKPTPPVESEKSVPKAPPPAKVSKRKTVQPWDDPETLKALEACRPRILELLSDQKETTKQGCADALGINSGLAGRTLSYMMTQTKEIIMIEPPKTEADPEPKKRFRRKK